MNRQWIWSVLAVAFAVCGISYTGYHVGALAMQASALVTVVVVLALAFDFTNGIHDAANSIATVVSTRVLSPIQAVVWAAFFNFVAAYVFGTHVAMTIGKGIVQPEVVDTLHDSQRAAGGHPLEPHHLVLWDSPPVPPTR